MADTEILFPEPCHQDWETMHPDGRARLCDACGKKVHDLSRYTPEEADGLLFGDHGPACLRVTILPDGRVATLPGRRGKLLMAAIATPALLLAAAGASAGPHMGAIAGSVSTAGAPVRVTAVAAGLRRSTRVDEGGLYRFDRLPPGVYMLVFSTDTSRQWTIPKVAVRANRVTVRNSYDPELPVFVTAGVPVPIQPIQAPANDLAPAAEAHPAGD